MFEIGSGEFRTMNKHNKERDLYRESLTNSAL